MRQKPWPVLILAFLHVIAPITSILFTALMTGVPIREFFQVYFSMSPWDFIQYAGLFPIAGFALYAYRVWSYPVFLAVMGWAFFKHFEAYQSAPDLITLPMLVGAFLINMGVVGYFLIPAVRAPYFDPKLRWWASQARYHVNLSGAIETQEACSKCWIADISLSGAFIATVSKFELGSELTVKFFFLGKAYEFPARVMHQGRTDLLGYGIRFELKTPRQKEEIKNLIQWLKGFGAKNNREDWLKDFQKWATAVLTKGEGLVPTLPTHVPEDSAQPASEPKKSA